MRPTCCFLKSCYCLLGWFYFCIEFLKKQCVSNSEMVRGLAWSIASRMSGGSWESTRLLFQLSHWTNKTKRKSNLSSFPTFLAAICVQSTAILNSTQAWKLYSETDINLLYSCERNIFKTYHIRLLLQL